MRKQLGAKFKTLIKWDPDDLRSIWVQHPVDLSWV
jgi:putative transposase